MLEPSVSFVQIASFVTNRIAELLAAPVCVTNDRGIIITSSKPYREGLFGNWQDHEFTTVNFLRLPLYHRTEKGEIIVGKPIQQETISKKLAQALVELVIDQATTDHDYSMSQQKLKNQLIFDLLYGAVKDEAAILSRAKYLNIDLNPPRAVILINATDYIFGSSVAQCNETTETEQRRRMQLVIDSIVKFFHLPNDTICVDLGQGEVCVLKASDTKNLNLWVQREDISNGLGTSWANLAALKRAANGLLLRLRQDTDASISIGIGRYHPSIQGLARSYEDARIALSLGNQFQGYNRVHCLGELGIAAFIGVSDESTKIELAKYLLSPLDHEPELLMTLNVFFAEDCCLSSSAKRLSIHRNTLSYRFDKIATLTGLEPGKFDDAVQMRLCLLLRTLQSQN